MLLILPGQTLRRGLRPPIPLWSPTRFTGRAGPSRHCSTGSWPGSWKPFSPSRRRETATFQSSSRTSFALFSTAASWRGGRLSHTKYNLLDLPPRVEVTRRCHPLYGQELEVVNANKAVLTIRQPDGSTMKIPRTWTNAGPAMAVGPPSMGSVFTVEAVRDLIALLGALRHRD